MTDHANELRRYARKIAHPAGDVPSVMLAAADEIERLAARLEATEEDRARFLVEMGKLCAQCDALRAKVAEMEKQEPVAWMHETRRDSDVVTDAVKHVWGKVAVGSMAAYSIPLYTLPDAQTQPAPSVPDGWLRAIDEALVVAHVGVANESDTYEQAKAKLDSLLGFHVDAATDPAVNGGWKLVPIEPTEDMLRAMTDPFIAINGDNRKAFEIAYTAMLSAAPEAKP